ncbi:MAG: ferritin family protein [Chromatiales bacterium]|jgi:rubrerythrin
MTDMEGAKGAYARIRSKKSLREILEVAASFEASARDFYTDLIPKVGKNVRWVVEELALEEQEHYDLLKNLAARGDIASQVAAEIATPVSDGRFSDAVHIPDLGASPDDQAVLQYAMGREHLAMEHYRNLAGGTQPGPIRDLFEFLANEETKHKAELEKIYYETVHSGGV